MKIICRVDLSLHTQPFHSIIIPIFLLCGLVAEGCDRGLAPDEESSTPPRPYGISGVITFEHWPPTDSIRDLRLVAFIDPPSSDSIASAILQGKARYTETLLPFGIDSIPYTLHMAPLPPGTFSYIGVGQQFGPNILQDWRIVGVYSPDGDSLADSVVVLPDSIVAGVNVHVDFLNPPPQP